MGVRVLITRLNRQSVLIVTIALLSAAVLGWGCYALARYFVGQHVGGFLSTISQHAPPHRLSVSDYGALILFGMCGSLVGIVGMCLDMLMNQLSTRGPGGYFGLGLLGLIPLVLLLSLPAALILAMLALFNAGVTPSWF